MTEVRLVTQEARHRYGVPGTDNASFGVKEVVALALPESPLLFDPSLRQLSPRRESSIHLPEKTAERVVDFYAQTRAMPEGQRPRHNCMLFAYFVLGKTTKIEAPQIYQWDGHEKADPTNMQSGEGYALVDRAGNGLHDVIGIDQPDLSIGILGENNPLVVARTTALMAKYQTPTLYHLFVNDALPDGPQKP